MTPKEAYQVLSLPPGTKLDAIKKRFRQLMMQVHPDIHASSIESYPYNAQEINTAYSVLKKSLLGLQDSLSSKTGPSHAQNKKQVPWDAPINEHAYMEREILHYAQDCDGSILGSFCIAKGKYLWNTQEDFPLFLLSIYQCGKSLLDEIEDELSMQVPSAIRQKTQAELTYLLAQQFIDGTALLKELTKEEKDNQDGCTTYYTTAMLETSNRKIPIKNKELLYPSKIRQHRLYLKNQSGEELGYLSFQDDRLYYIIVPLFEQRQVRVKIQAMELRQETKQKKMTGYRNLHLWIKLPAAAAVTIPENLNLQIGQLLDQYRQKRY